MFYKVSKFWSSGKGGPQAPLPVGKGGPQDPTSFWLISIRFKFGLNWLETYFLSSKQWLSTHKKMFDKVSKFWSSGKGGPQAHPPVGKGGPQDPTSFWLIFIRFKFGLNWLETYFLSSKQWISTHKKMFYKVSKFWSSGKGGPQAHPPVGKGGPQDPTSFWLIFIRFKFGLNWLETYFLSSKQWLSTHKKMFYKVSKFWSSGKGGPQAHPPVGKGGPQDLTSFWLIFIRFKFGLNWLETYFLSSKQWLSTHKKMFYKVSKFWSSGKRGPQAHPPVGKGGPQDPISFWQIFIRFKYGLKLTVNIFSFIKTMTFNS